MFYTYFPLGLKFNFLFLNQYFVYGSYFVFFSMLSRQVEHKRWPFFFQNVFVDLSISLLQIRHLNIGVIIISSYFPWSSAKIYKKCQHYYSLYFLFIFHRKIYPSQNKNKFLHCINICTFHKEKRPATEAGLFVCKRFSKLDDKFRSWMMS